MIFKTMKPEDARKALEGQENVLKPAVEAHERYFRDLACPRCGSSVMAVVNPFKLFKEGAVLPSFLARCKGCGCEFEPYTKIEVAIPKFYPED